MDLDDVQTTYSLTLNAKELTFGDVTLRGGGGDDRIGRRGTTTVVVWRAQRRAEAWWQHQRSNCSQTGSWTAAEDGA